MYDLLNLTSLLPDWAMTQMVQKTMLLHLFLTSNCSFFSPPFLPVVCRGYVQQPRNVRWKENCWKIETRSVDFFYILYRDPPPFWQYSWDILLLFIGKEKPAVMAAACHNFWTINVRFYVLFGIFIVLIFLGGYCWGVLTVSIYSIGSNPIYFRNYCWYSFL